MAVKLVIEPLFEADFVPCSFGFRPKRTPPMALSQIVQSFNAGFTHVVDVDLQSYLETSSYYTPSDVLESKRPSWLSTTLMRRPLRLP